MGAVSSSKKSKAREKSQVGAKRFKTCKSGNTGDLRKRGKTLYPTKRRENVLSVNSEEKSPLGAGKHETFDKR